MSKILDFNPYLKKDNYENDEIYNQENHMEFISNIINDIDFDGKKHILQKIKNKLSSYKSQDKINKKFDEEKFISLSQLLEMIRDSNLKCYYCNCDMLLVYKNKKETKQWSLERLDNNLGHYNTNTCISCLECNLKRRQSNHEYFKYSKNLVIKKV